MIHLKIPALRERPEDIAWLAHHLLASYCSEHPGEIKRMPPAVEQALTMHQWPGNIRELKHAIERACILSPGTELMLDALFETPVPQGLGDTDTPEGLVGYLKSCERAYIVNVLDANDGQIVRTAAALGISRKNLWERMRRLGIDS